MKKEKNPVLMIEDDFRRLRRLSQGNTVHRETSLAHELDRAIILSKSAFPRHAVRLNSFVSVLDVHSDTVLEFTIVMPEEANQQEKKLSVLSPMGTALIGFRKKEEIRWKFPGGYKRLKILDVQNSAA